MNHHWAVSKRPHRQDQPVDAREQVTLTRLDAVLAMRAGQVAARGGQRPTACPWSPTGNATERVRVQAWLRGYLGH
jgi:hypothetical protein